MVRSLTREIALSLDSKLILNMLAYAAKQKRCNYS